MLEISLKSSLKSSALSRSLLSAAETSGDLVLVCDDSSRVHLHSSIVTSVSGLMAQVLTDHLRCPHHAQVLVTVPGVERQSLETIREMFYLKTVRVSKHNLDKVMEVAKMLGLNDIKLEVPESSKNFAVETNNEDVVDLSDASESQAEGNDIDNDSDSDINSNNSDSDNQMEDDDDVNEDEDGKELDDQDYDESKANYIAEPEPVDVVSTIDCIEDYVKLLMDDKDTDEDEEKAKVIKITDRTTTKCPICKKVYKTRKIMRKHYLTAHTEAGMKKAKEPTQCNICGKIFKGRKGLTNHRSMYHSEMKEIHYCDQCSYSSVHKTYLKHHRKIVHEEKEFICDLCSASFTYKIHLKTHIETVHEGKKLKCDQCPYQTGHSNHLKKHIEVVHLKIRHPCDMCDAKYANKGHLVYHKREKHGVETAKYRKPYCMKKKT